MDDLTLQTQPINSDYTNGHSKQVLERVPPQFVVKRDGNQAKYDLVKITNAIDRCFSSLSLPPKESALATAKRVENILSTKTTIPTIEEIQDLVEIVLQASGEFEAAKHYILYRAEHSKLREVRPVPEEIKEAFEKSDIYFPTQLQKFQFFDKYSRFSYDLGRRETWAETVDRAVDFLHKLGGDKLGGDVYERIRKSILEMRSAPSMRLLAMAGPAADRQNASIYNCSYLPVDSIDAFCEAMLISMSGCGVGFSVESKYVENLPRIKRQINALPLKMIVEDSTEGWMAAIRQGMSIWFDGGDIQFDYSQVRPAGALLKIKGGRASGPAPLRHAIEFAKRRILSRQGSFLRSIDAHDIMCEVGNAAVAGGSRRTAMISLFDWDDEEMRNCKSGDFEKENSQRWNANNSAVWPDRGITQPEMVHQMLDMIDGGRGEPGIFNRQAAINMRPARRKVADFGTNPSLRKGTLVYTTEGIFPIDQLQDKTFVVRNLNGKLSQAECFLSGENKPLYEIILSNGQSYYATKEHKWAIKSRYNEVRKITSDKLKPGMYFPVLRSESLEFGTEGTREEGFLAGWLTGDGWMTTRGDNGHTQIGLILAETDLYLRKKLESQLKKIGCLSIFQKRQRGNSVWYEINTQSEPLVKWCRKYGIEGKKAGVPDFIWKSASEDFRKGFVDGLFSSDGSVTDGGIILTTAHKKLAEDIQSLLGFYGINGTIKHMQIVGKFPNGKDYDKAYDRYDLRIRSKTNAVHFRKAFPLSHKEKSDKLEQF